MKNFFLSLVLLCVGSCSKDTEYNYVHSRPPAQLISSQFSALKDLVTGYGSTDILWVIDNSGSMSQIQSNIVANTDKFIREFVKLNSIGWRMGLISTDYSEDPYLGFDPIFDYRDSNPVARFQNAVGKLGLLGSTVEKTMEPIQRKLLVYPDFLREDAMLAVIMVTDEKEQTFDGYLKKEEFLRDLIQLKGSERLVKFYGIMDARDLGCDSSGGLNYYNSKFEYLINETGGSYFKACAEDFGTDLAQISNDIISNLLFSKYLLERRPKINTIRVVFEGKVIPSVDSTGKRKWFYNKRSNSIIFMDLNFIDPSNLDPKLDVKYEVDNGF